MRVCACVGSVFPFGRPAKMGIVARGCGRERGVLGSGPSGGLGATEGPASTEPFFCVDVCPRLRWLTVKDVLTLAFVSVVQTP